METTSKLNTRTPFRIALYLMAGLMLMSGIALADEAEKRVSITTQGASGSVRHDEFDALVKEGARKTHSKSTSLLKVGAAESQAPNVDFWFYSADVELFSDHDNDGFFQGIDVLFDADTYFESADVYAVLYLSLDGGPWNEYAATENFTIFGASADDDYVIVTELVSGYPSGSYDLLIELFDAYDDTFLAWIGPEDTSELAFLPLEDSVRDAPDVPDVIVVRERGGGSVGWLLLLALGATTVARLLRPSGSQ